MTDPVSSNSYLRELVEQNRRFGALCANGVPVLLALAALEADASPPFAEVLRVIIPRVATGELLSQAMAEFPRLFPAIYREWVRLAEETGTLDSGAQEVAELLEPVALSGTEETPGWSKSRSPSR